MSISSEISRLQTAKANIKTALENKGVEVSASAKLDAYPTYIDNIPSGGDDSWIKTVSKSEFSGTQLMSANSYITDIDIPSGVTTIVAVGSLSNLTACTIPNTVRTINYRAFYQCSKLPSVEIPDSVTEIGMSAFTDCWALKNIEIPSGVTTLSKYIFKGCSNLSGVTLHNGLTTIGEGAFSSCTSLTTGITIPDTVTSIGNSAFIDCRNLRRINIPSGVTSIGNNTFQYCQLLSSCTISSGVTSIGHHAFSDCYKLQNFNIPNSVTTIGYCAFSMNTGLTSIVIPDGVTSIEGQTFFQCTSLSSFTFGSGVTSIGNGALQNCYSLTNLEIPSGVTSIADSAFEKCSGLTSITVNAVTPPNLGSNAFNNTNNCPIYVPADSVNAYKAATNWSAYASRIQAIPTPSNWIVLNQYEQIPEGTYSNLRIHSATTINDGEHIIIDDGTIYNHIGSYCTDTEHEEWDCESFDVGYCPCGANPFDPMQCTLEPFTFSSDGYWYLNDGFDSVGTLTAPFELELLEAESNEEEEEEEE